MVWKYVQLVRADKVWLFTRRSAVHLFLHTMTARWRSGSLLALWSVCASDAACRSVTDRLFCVIAYGLTAAARLEMLPYPIFFQKLIKCAIAAFLMRSAACTINDILDRTFDASVGQYLSSLPAPSLSFVHVYLASRKNEEQTYCFWTNFRVLCHLVLSLPAFIKRIVLLDIRWSCVRTLLCHNL